MADKQATPERENPMPDDLRRVLSDPSIVIRQDGAVFDLIAKWMKAPTTTGPERRDA